MSHFKFKFFILLIIAVIVLNSVAQGKTRGIDEVKSYFTTGILYINFHHTYTYGIKFKHKISIDGVDPQNITFPFQIRLKPGKHIVYIYREYTKPNDPKKMDNLDMLAMQAISTSNSLIPKENLDAKVPVKINKFKTTRLLLSFKTFATKKVK